MPWLARTVPSVGHAHQPFQRIVLIFGHAPVAILPPRQPAPERVIVFDQLAHRRRHLRQPAEPVGRGVIEMLHARLPARVRGQARDLVRPVVAELGQAILRIGHRGRAAQRVAPVTGHAVQPGARPIQPAARILEVIARAVRELHGFSNG